MKGYVISGKGEDGKTYYYCHSSSKDVDRTDINYAKVFVNTRALRQGLVWWNYHAAQVLEVDVEVKVLGLVSADITKVF